MPISAQSTPVYPILDPQTVPIVGNMMIEASAGTGKTYTITLLVLRLLLGLNEQDPEPKKLPEILIVTFTNAATAELKERIYTRIVELKRAFFITLAGKENADSALQALIHQFLALEEPQHGLRGALEKGINLLNHAESSIDQASIFTIHAFSQRVLKENALDLGQSFKFELATDLSLLYREAVYHFWREECYPLDFELTKIVADYFSVPMGNSSRQSSLFSKIRPLLSYPDLIDRSGFTDDDTLEKVLSSQKQLLNDIRERVLIHLGTVEDFRKLVDEVGLNKRSYNKTVIENNHAKLIEWAHNGGILERGVKERFSLISMADRLAADGDLAKLKPEHEAIFADLDQTDTFKHVALHFAADRVVKILQILKHESGVLGFDDLLTVLNRKVKSVSNHFIESLHLRYKAVMIDEFQDTDHLQLETFRKLFFDHPNIAFVMIGDPKQSIYGFRGADINAYLSIKKDVDAIYTLNTNYRSGTLQVDAVNRLFDNNDVPFIEKEIPFINIKTPEAANFTKVIVGDQEPAGMVLLDYIPQDDEKMGMPLFRARIAAGAAIEIANLLENGELELMKGDVLVRRKIMPEDITILVRSGTEALDMQTALREKGLNSVYLSERNSVFDPDNSIVVDLYLFLKSLVFKHDQGVFRQTLGSILYGFSVDELEAVKHDVHQLEQLFIERNELNEIWNRHGVLAMLRTFMVRENRLARLLVLDNGERYASDLFHLGELLQREQFSNKEALLLWLQEKMQNADSGEGSEVRLESDFKTIQIMTIHKSKGLEFPIVFLPFGLFKTTAKKEGVYVDGNGERRYLFSEEADATAANFFRKETLAEDIRLLYVALTRAKFQTYVGFCQSLSESSYRDNALSYLLELEEQKRQEAPLPAYLSRFFAVRPLRFKNLTLEKNIPNSAVSTALTPAIFNRKIAPLWRFTSFSNLSYNAKPNYFTPLITDEKELEEDSLNMDQAESLFPKGSITGNFIHELLENYTPEQLQDRTLLKRNIEKSFAHMIDANLFPLLTDELEKWLKDIFYASLPFSSNLYKILAGRQNVKELEFIFPIENILHKRDLNTLLNQHLKRDGEEMLEFEDIRGFLRGFIDLFFEIDGRYYVADYKSNTLGARKSDYHLAQMEHSIKHAHYDLQYLIYTVAIVKFLRNQKPDFDYDRDFGGVFYFYLRGMEAETDSGIYFIKPDYSIVQALMALFGEEKAEEL